MSQRQVYETLGYVAAANAIIGFLLALVAVIVTSDRIGGLAAVFAAGAFLPGFAFALWSADAPRAQPRRSRADRRRLADEKQRIDLEAEIRRMEREAGL